MIRFSAGKAEGGGDFADDLITEARRDAVVAVDRVTILAVNTAKRVLTGQRSGRAYKMSRTGFPHVASAPGEPPAVLTGRLRNSIARTLAKVRGNEVEGEWGTNVEYAERLETGGRNRDGSRFYPRPWARPTEQRIEPALDRLTGDR